MIKFFGCEVYNFGKFILFDSVFFLFCSWSEIFLIYFLLKGNVILFFAIRKYEYFWNYSRVFVLFFICFIYFEFFVIINDLDKFSLFYKL